MLFLLALIGVLILAALMRCVSALLGGLALMHLLGIIHHEWASAVPAIGYWWACLMALLISVVIVPLNFEFKWSKEVKRVVVRG